jgi:GNAT superfamily N-acetyltransferase
MTAETKRDGIEFRIATPEDAKALVDFRNSYHGVTRTRDHWTWEYDTFEPKKTVFVFARDRGKIIATQGIIPIPLRIGTSSLLTGKTEDTLCLPPYRGFGIMSGLYEYAVENCIHHKIQFIWGFTSAVAAYRRFGFICYPDVQVVARSGNVRVDVISRLQGKMPLWRRVGSAGKAVLKSLPQREMRAIPQIQEQSGYDIKRGWISGEGLKELRERVLSSNQNVVCTDFDQRYLSWRVREHPFLNYDEYQVYKGPRLCGYAIVVLSQGTASISDLLADDSYAISLLLYTIIKDYFKRAGRFRFLVNPKDRLSQAVYDQLSTFGFSVDEKTSRLWALVLRDLSDGKYRQIFDIHNWHISALWTEGFLY